MVLLVCCVSVVFLLLTQLQPLPDILHLFVLEASVPNVTVRPNVCIHNIVNIGHLCELIQSIPC